LSRGLALLPVWAWLAVFVAAPAALIAAIGFATGADGVPPYRLGWNTANLAQLVADDFYLRAFLSSLRISAISTLLCLALGYPMALAIARSPAASRGPLVLLAILPFWTGFLLRMTAWIGLLRDDGWVNAALGWFGLGPFRLLYTDFAMYCGILYGYLPFMVLPLVARLTRLDPALEQAAADLGASPLRVVLRVTLPLSWPGIAAGIALVFVPVMGEYVIPDLLGGPGAQTIGRVLWDAFFADRDWPGAAALALVLLAVLLLAASLLRLARR
jgi:putrescine transport system permease protein